MGQRARQPINMAKRDLGAEPGSKHQPKLRVARPSASGLNSGGTSSTPQHADATPDPLEACSENSVSWRPRTSAAAGSTIRFGSRRARGSRLPRARPERRGQRGDDALGGEPEAVSAAAAGPPVRDSDPGPAAFDACHGGGPAEQSPRQALRAQSPTLCPASSRPADREIPCPPPRRRAARLPPWRRAERSAARAARLTRCAAPHVRSRNTASIGKRMKAV